MLKESHCPSQAIYILRMVAGSPAEEKLLEGDIVVSIESAGTMDGEETKATGGLKTQEQLVTRFRDIELVAQYNRSCVLTLFRDGQLRRETIDTIPLINQETTRFVLWCGAFVQVTLMPLRLWTLWI